MAMSRWITLGISVLHLLSKVESRGSDRRSRQLLLESTSYQIHRTVDLGICLLIMPLMLCKSTVELV